MIVDCTMHDQSIALQKNSHCMGGRRSSNPGVVIAKGNKGLRVGATMGSQLEIPLGFEDGGRIKDFMADTGAMVHASGSLPPGYGGWTANGGRVFLNRQQVFGR